MPLARPASKTSHESHAGVEDVWPLEDLEVLGQCPVCQSKQRQLLYDGVRDWTFATTADDWTFWRCQACDTGYLDPRPSETSIHRAYRVYYTHESRDGAETLSFASETTPRAKLIRDFYRAAYGLSLGASWLGGRFIAYALPQHRAFWEHRIRHLPAPKTSGEALLDIGCGNGEFLMVANRLGYSATGLDMDLSAVAAARRSGLDARSGQLPTTGLLTDSYTQITLNHVFEHLHRPKESLTEIARLLKPGGRLWLSQPNLDAAGRLTFGRYWRGLEAPRHLCLFDPDSLGALLKAAGFRNIKLLPPVPHTEQYFMQSVAMRDGLAPRYDLTPPGWNEQWKRRAKAAQREAMRRPATAESFTIAAEQG